MTTTDLFGRVQSNQGLYFLYGNGFTDGSDTELKVQDISGTLIPIGEHLADQILLELAIMCSDGSILTTAVLTAKDGGVVTSWRGNERGYSTDYNLDSKELNIPLEKGMILTVNTGD